MGQNQSNNASTLGKSSKDKQFQELYQHALKRVEDEMPRLKDIYKLITKHQEQTQQINEFCRLLYQGEHSNNMRDITQDRRNLMGSSIYTAYLSNQRGTIKFENFVRLYATLVKPEGEEQSELAFRIYAMTPPEVDEEKKEQYLQASRIQTVAMRKIGLSQEQVIRFITNLQITKDRKVYKSEFKEIFIKYRDDPHFTWLDDFNKTFEGTQNAQLEGTILKPEKHVSMDSIDFTEEEFKVLDNYFEQNIANQTEITQATKKFKWLISDRSIHMKLRDRLIESFLYASNSDFYEKKVYLKNMFLMFKERDDFNMINFIFDIFTKYAKDQIMTAPQIKDVFTVFRRQIPSGKQPQQLSSGLLQQNYDEDDLTVQIQHLQSLDRGTFIDCYFEYLDHKPQFRIIQTILYIELGVRPQTGELERQIIFNTLEGTMNFNKYTLSNMKKGDYFNLINKKFYDSWDTYTKSGSKQSFYHKFNIETSKDSGSQLKIENDCLFVSKDVGKHIQLKRDDNFVIIPPRVWNAFQEWYGKSNEVRRYVVEYTHDSNSMLEMSGTNNLKKLSEDNKNVIELEIDLIMIKIGMLLENGKQPDSHYIQYISRYMTMNEVKEKACRLFKLRDLERTQLWMKDELLHGDVLSSMVEQNREIKDGMKFFIEQMLENQRWPSEQKMIKQQAKNAEILDLKTVGCFNMGNTCYINSVIQCVANTHYFKDYFLRTMYFKQNDAGQYPLGAIESLREVDFKNHINSKNPMGYEGNIVKSFAKLIEDMYTSKFACVLGPKKFKSTVARYHEQFQGSNQQDAQEFLVIILDSLHEDLNIRQTKPYIEKPGSEFRDEDELSIEVWSNFLHRNWSFIGFLFYGQMRSFLKCNECAHERVSFDVFSTLSLPLPESSLINFKVVIQLLPSEIKFILENQVDIAIHLNDKIDRQRKQTLNFEVHESSLQSLTKERPIVLSISMQPTQQVYEITDYLVKNFKNLNLLKPPKNGINPLDSKQTEIMYYLMSELNDSIHIIIPPDTFLNQIREGTYIQAVEMLTAKGKHEIQEFYKDTQYEIQQMNKNVLLNFQGNIQQEEDFPEIELMEKEQHIEVRKSSVGSFRIETEEIKMPEYNELEGQIEHPIQQDENIMKQEEIESQPQQNTENLRIEEESKQSDKFFDIKREIKTEFQPSQQQSNIIYKDTQYYDYAKYQLSQQTNLNRDFQSYYQNIIKGPSNTYPHPIGMKPIIIDQIVYQPPEEILVYLISRKIVSRDLYFTLSSRFQAKTFGKPLFIFANRDTTGRALYEEVWMRARYMLNFTHAKFYEDPQNLWWNRFRTNEERIFAMKEQSQFVPFVLKFVKNVTSDLQICSLCLQNYKKCFGCIVEPESKLPLYDVLLENSFLAIDWNLEFLQQYYQSQSQNPIEHDTLKDSNNSQKKHVELTDCLKMFESIEEIPVREGVKCDKCQIPTHHIRKMGVSKAPPILIIHLKRFKIINNTKKKIDQYVHYPLYDLNMTPFLTNNQSQSDAIYDLYGIINHFGGLNSGHYTCFIKNERTKHWYSYDDSYVKEVPESKVHSQYAYILFYKRRDISSMPLERVYPSLSFQQDWFRGQPVKLKKQYGIKNYGFLWDKRVEPNIQDIYHVKLGSIDFFTTLECLDFQDDLDDLSHLNEIKRDSIKETEPTNNDKKQEEVKKDDKKSKKDKSKQKKKQKCIQQ